MLVSGQTIVKVRFGLPEEERTSVMFRGQPSEKNVYNHT